MSKIFYHHILVYEAAISAWLFHSNAFFPFCMFMYNCHMEMRESAYCLCMTRVSFPY